MQGTHWQLLLSAQEKLSNPDLQGQLANMTASLNQLQSDYEALKAEHEKLKGRRGSSGKAAPKR